MDLVSARVITGDVACLAGLFEKATGVHEGRRKEGMNEHHGHQCHEAGR